MKILLELRKKFPNIISVTDHFEGDRWYSEESTNYKFNLKNLKLEIIYYKITEDDIDWAQAESESYEEYKLNDENINKKEASDILDNIEAYIRDEKLEQIMK